MMAIRASYRGSGGGTVGPAAVMDKEFLPVRSYHKEVVGAVNTYVKNRQLIRMC